MSTMAGIAWSGNGTRVTVIAGGDDPTWSVEPIGGGRAATGDLAAAGSVVALVVGEDRVYIGREGRFVVGVDAPSATVRTGAGCWLVAVPAGWDEEITVTTAEGTRTLRPLAEAVVAAT